MLIIFDLDGTLIDSRRDLADAANAVVAEYGGMPLEQDAVAAMVGEGARLLVQRALRAASVEADDDAALARFLEIYDERLLAHTTLYPGMLDALAAMGRDARLAVLTNKPRHHTERILDGLGIAQWFGDVIGGDTPLGRKPDPAGLLALMQRAGASRQATILVGDSAVDLRTARAAGVGICLARYGFGFRLAAAELAGDELLADDPSDIPRLLGRR